MKNFLGRRGAVHVDWVISMGLFLIYIITLFILIRPGSYAEHKPENLFTIIESNFIRNVSTNIKEIQFVVEKCDVDNGQKSKITIEDENHKYRFSELIGNDGTLISDEQGKTFPGVSVGNKLTITCGSGEFSPITTRRVFTVTAYPKEHINFYDINFLPVFKATCDNSNKNKCNVFLGAITDFIGFDESYLNDLISYGVDDKGSPYSEISKSWGFPENKKFNITITKNNIATEISSKEKPLEGTNVFVRRFNNIYLNKFNERENAEVHIDVW